MQPARRECTPSKTRPIFLAQGPAWGPVSCRSPKMQALVWGLSFTGLKRSPLRGKWVKGRVPGMDTEDGGGGRACWVYVRLVPSAARW